MNLSCVHLSALILDSKHSKIYWCACSFHSVVNGVVVSRNLLTAVLVGFIVLVTCHSQPADPLHPLPSARPLQPHPILFLAMQCFLGGRGGISIDSYWAYKMEYMPLFFNRQMK